MTGTAGGYPTHNSPTFVHEDDEHEERPERDGWHDEEVDGHDLIRVVREERSPCLRRWTGMSPHVLGAVDWLVETPSF